MCTFDEELAVSEFLEGSQFREAKSAILGKGETRDRVNMHAVKKSSSISYPVVTFLGTGSSLPSKHKNMSQALSFCLTVGRRPAGQDEGEGGGGEGALWAEGCLRLQQSLACRSSSRADQHHPA